MRAYLVRWCVAQGKMGRVPQARARYTASQPSNPPKSRDTGLNRARTAAGDSYRIAISDKGQLSAAISGFQQLSDSYLR